MVSEAAIAAGAVLVLLGLGAALFWRRGKAGPSPGAGDDEGPPVLEHDVFHLRCESCGTTFDVPDTSQRPLVHACPGCGRKGVLKVDGSPK